MKHIEDISQIPYQRVEDEVRRTFVATEAGTIALLDPRNPEAYVSEQSWWEDRLDREVPEVELPDVRYNPFRLDQMASPTYPAL